LNLEIKPSEILIKGIGNETIMPKGMDHVLFGFESFSVSSDVHFFDANMGDIEVIIGQPIINNRELSLKIQGQNLVLEKLTQIKKYPIELKESVCLCPGKTALIPVKPINHSPNRCLLVKAKNVEFPERYNILSTVIRTSDDCLTVTNTGSQNMCWEKGRIITRAIDYVESDLKTTNLSDCKKILSLKKDRIKVNLTVLKEPNLSAFYKMLYKYHNCFVGKTSDLGGTDIIEF
jgi:hypothetical protein